MADALNKLVSQFLDVSRDVNALSSASPTDDVAAQLGTAARDTELALRTLRDAAVEQSKPTANPSAAMR